MSGPKAPEQRMPKPEEITAEVMLSVKPDEVWKLAVARILVGKGIVTYEELLEEKMRAAEVSAAILRGAVEETTEDFMWQLANMGEEEAQEKMMEKISKRGNLGIEYIRDGTVPDGG